jgi:type II secretory pathway component PulC
MRSTTMPAERRSSPLIVGGGAALAVLLLLVIFGRDSDDPPPADPPAPQPASPSVAPLAVAPPSAAPAASPEALRLYGVAGAGAIIGVPDGGQRLFPIGRDVLPGLTLVSVGVDHAMLRSSAGTYRLGFDGVTAGQAAPAAAPSRPQGIEAAVRDETLRYRHGLAPVAEGGRVTGHVVRAGTPMPALERAGIRPGDVILRVNGSQLNEEQREELAWTLVHSSEVRFEIVRAGQPMSLTLAR